MKKILSSVSIYFLFSSTIVHAQNWEEVGTGLNDKVYDLIKFDGKLYACGRIGVKYWDGNSWTSLPNPFGVAYPLTIQVYNNEIYIGGDFPWTGSVSHVYKYSGGSWVQVGGDFLGMAWSSTKCLLTFGGHLISGGHYSYVGGQARNNISAWNGSTWEQLGNGLNDVVTELAEHNGRLYASGHFTASGSDASVQKIATWNGTNWMALSPTHTFKTAGSMTSFDGALIVGNVWDTIAGIPMKGVVAWDGTDFHAMGNDSIQSVGDFGIFHNELYMSATTSPWVMGSFLHVVLKWDGQYWHQVGTNFDDVILALDNYQNYLFCAGFFESTHSYIAQFSDPLAIKKNESSAQLNFFPNPISDGKLFLQSEMDGDLIISDQSGKILFKSQIVDRDTEIDVSTLKPGVYFLTFVKDGESIMKKFVIQ